MDIIYGRQYKIKMGYCTNIVLPLYAVFYIDSTRHFWYNPKLMGKCVLPLVFPLPKEAGRLTISKAQQRATANYVKKNYDRIEVKVLKGKKEVIQAHAEAQGESLNAFINRAITETMERDAPAAKEEEE